MKLYFPSLFILLIFFITCNSTSNKKSNISDQEDEHYYQIDRSVYSDKLEGFWLAESIANWTGLTTEMDKIGYSMKNGLGGGFYTRADWGKADIPSIWGGTKDQKVIDFVLLGQDSIWGSDDDTDIEYIYQELMTKSEDVVLSPEQIKNGWLTHIKKEEENFLWVSNQTAFDLMQKGILPPQTGQAAFNNFYEMIDAQLTTEIFGLYAPLHPEIALKLSHLPIRISADGNAIDIAEFYVTMHALASFDSTFTNLKEQTVWMAEQASKQLAPTQYPAKMYQYIKSLYQQKIPWEAARDSLHQKYQIRNEDGYEWSKKDSICYGCIAAGINFGASLVSLFYGEGEIKETIKIGSLCGWDSDNPTATWGGLLGFMMGKKKIEEAFGMKFSNRYNIHRTRIGFPNNGIDTFDQMADKGLKIVDKVVVQMMKGKLDTTKNVWLIPKSKIE
ncbi:MAG TPA: ADP-ribosylglycohydrolase family protein [Saprospiraceae bacterium]|nr:ADP-ribosylglycohydrolase family protein [Saprospiraceae bacterium]HPN67875.1 ADP-ribosylglycohydrolase family protein [Saprospiraceae bacterium]